MACGRRRRTDETQVPGDQNSHFAHQSGALGQVGLLPAQNPADRSGHVASGLARQSHDVPILIANDAVENRRASRAPG
jgi:hypothetical protein